MYVCSLCTYVLILYSNNSVAEWCLSVSHPIVVLWFEPLSVCKLCSQKCFVLSVCTVYIRGGQLCRWGGPPYFHSHTRGPHCMLCYCSKICIWFYLNWNPGGVDIFFIIGIKLAKISDLQVKNFLNYLLIGILKR